MLKYITYSLIVLTFAVGCATKPKPGEEGGADGALSSSDISEKPLSYDPMGSDSGTIAGLTTVHFDFDSSTLRSDTKSELDQNVAWMNANPGTSIQIEGHCDSKGSNEYNLSLGERRANSVKAYMQSKGIDAKRMSTISYGEEKLISLGDTEADHAKNRRANFVPSK
jgi:peptidoglycan-associated lipoprotein